MGHIHSKDWMAVRRKASLIYTTSFNYDCCNPACMDGYISR